MATVFCNKEKISFDPMIQKKAVVSVAGTEYVMCVYQIPDSFAWSASARGALTQATTRVAKRKRPLSQHSYTRAVVTTSTRSRRSVDWRVSMFTELFRRLQEPDASRVNRMAERVAEYVH